MSTRYDDDGRELVRTRDGDLVYVTTPASPPAYRPDEFCAEHGGIYGYRAATCSACWSEIKGGDRLIEHLGRAIS